MNIIKHEGAFGDLMNIGKAFAESGLFADIKSAAQAVVKIQAGSEMGLPPMASMTGIHIIQGKVVVGAGLLAARVGKNNYRVRQLDDKACIIDFLDGSEVLGTSTFTIEDAKKAGTKNIDKFPRNMLFARAMSNGVKWFTPDIFSMPVYVPGEIEDQSVQDITAELITPFEDYIKQVLNAATVEELTALKATTPEHVKQDKGWKNAATDRYNFITKVEGK